MKRLTALLAAACLSSLAGCVPNPFAPTPIASDTWVEIAPLSGYSAEFERMRACASAYAGITFTDSLAGDVQHFYMVQRGDVRSGGVRAAALIHADDSTGVSIAIAEDYLRDKDIVRHEFIHALQVKHSELLPGGAWHPLGLFNRCNVPVAIVEG